jgi:hypothetical protein
MWIRSPAWDGFWFLSGVPLGVALWATSATPMTTFLFILVFRVGHLAAPVACAWSHTGFRELMLRRKATFILLPSFLFVTTAAVSWWGLLKVGNDYDLYFNWARMTPLAVIAAIVYIGWNQWHLAMQNFGMLRLYAARSRRAGSRLIDKGVCLLAMAYWTAGIVTHYDFIPIPRQIPFEIISCFAAAVLMAVVLWYERSWPRIVFMVGTITPAVIANFSFLYAFAAILVNHWLSAIGLAAHVDGNHHARSPLLFAAVVMAFGAAVVATRPHFRFVLAATIGLAFVHFLYDRWLWRFSEKRVRETIGRDLFRRPAGAGDDSARFGSPTH